MGFFQGRARALAFVVYAGYVSAAVADESYLAKTVSHDFVFTERHYRKGELYRSEYIDAAGRVTSITVQSRSSHIVRRMDPVAKLYAEQTPSTDWIAVLAFNLRRPEKVRYSGKKVDLYYEAIDTGERKQFFGKDAQHWILRERQVAAEGACSSSYDKQRDGWYLPRSGPSLGVIYLLASAVGPCRDEVERHGRIFVPGFPVSEVFSQVQNPVQASPTGYAAYNGPALSKYEVIEYSDQPLSLELFAVPRDFRRVDHLPGDHVATWNERLSAELFLLLSAVQSWFN